MRPLIAFVMIVCACASKKEAPPPDSRESRSQVEANNDAASDRATSTNSSAGVGPTATPAPTDSNTGTPGQETTDTPQTPPSQVVDLALSYLLPEKNLVVADGVDSTLITVSLLDSTGIPVAARSVSLNVNGTSNALDFVALQTNNAGEAQFHLSSTKAEAKSVTVFVDGKMLVEEANITFVAGALDPAHTQLVASVPDVIADDVDATTITVTALDAFDNPVSGTLIDLAVSGAANTIDTTPAATATNGTVQFSVRSQRSEDKVISAAFGTTNILQTQSLQFHAGNVDAPNSTFTLDRSVAVANNTNVVTASVSLRDKFDNIVVGQGVSLTSSGGGNTIAPGLTVTDVAGAATFTLKSSQVGNKTITANYGSGTFSANVAFVNAWQKRSKPSGVSYYTVDRRALGFDPTSNALYVLTASGVYKSADRGVSWVDASAGLPANPNANGSPYLYSLVLDRFDPNRLFVTVSAANTATSGLYRSTNGGTTWARTQNGVAADCALSDVFPSVAQNAFYAVRTSSYQCGPGEAGIYKTTNGGDSWTRIVNTELIGLIAVHPTTGRFFAGSDNLVSGAYRQSDSEGASWSYGGAGIPRRNVQVGCCTIESRYYYVSELFFDPFNGNNMLANVVSGYSNLDHPFATANTGMTWQMLGYGTGWGLNARTAGYNSTIKNRVYGHGGYPSYALSASDAGQSSTGPSWYTITDGLPSISNSSSAPMHFNRLNGEEAWVFANDELYYTFTGGK